MHSKKLDIKIDPPELDTSLFIAHLTKHGIDPIASCTKDEVGTWYHFNINQGSAILATYYFPINPNQIEQYVAVEFSLGTYLHLKQLNKAILELTTKMQNYPFPLRISYSESDTKIYRLLLTYRNKLKYLSQEELEELMQFFALFSLNEPTRQ